MMTWWTLSDHFLDHFGSTWVPYSGIEPISEHPMTAVPVPWGQHIAIFHLEGSGFHRFKISAFVTIVAYSTSKYLKYKTSFQRTTRHEELVLYPSISICKKWTYDNYIDEQILNENVTFANVRELVVSEIWERRRVIYFLRFFSKKSLTTKLSYTWFIPNNSKNQTQ